MEKFKRISFIWIIIAILVMAGLFALVSKDEDVEIETYENAALGIRFDFPDKYRIESRELGNGKNGHLSIILVDKAFIPVEGGEGPPVIAFDFYQSPAEPDIRAWVTTNAQASLHQSPEAVRDGILSGKPAVYFPSDGLYAGDSVMVAHKDYFLLIQGQYMTREDEIRQDFQEVLRSVEFF